MVCAVHHRLGCLFFCFVDAYPCLAHSRFDSRVRTESQGGGRLWRRALSSGVVMVYLFCLLFIGASWCLAAAIYGSMEAALWKKK